jgi:hypothetical protein
MWLGQPKKTAAFPHQGQGTTENVSLRTVILFLEIWRGKLQKSLKFRANGQVPSLEWFGSQSSHSISVKKWKKGDGMMCALRPGVKHSGHPVNCVNNPGLNLPSYPRYR